LRKKIETATEGKEVEKEEKAKKAPAPTSALQSLSQYADDDDDDDEDEGEAPTQEEIKKIKEKLPVPSVASTVSTSSFYGGGGPTNATPFKNKSNFQHQPGSPKRNRLEGAGQKKKKSFVSSPFNAITGNSNFRRYSTAQKYGRRKRMII